MKLTIIYKNRLLLEQHNNKITLLEIPEYFHNSDAFSNISNFIVMLCANIMDNEYNSKVKLNYFDWANIHETYFLPEALKQIDEESFIYDLDDAIKSSSELTDELIDNNLKTLPVNLLWASLDELVNQEDINNDEYSENDSYSYTTKKTYDTHILRILKVVKSKRSNKDVLLLYSGGKDSTLSAIRLKNMGYNPYFIHFNNGSMLDVDKPFLTFKNTFENLEGYHFPYEYSNVDISKLFLNYFKDWHEKDKNPLLTSEIRCLSCRMAMYTKTLEIASHNNFKLVAEGARISQKFFIEQEKFIPKFKELAQKLGITLLYPVLHLEDDKELIKELLANNNSAKTWESKCLLGQSALDKTKEDEDVIMQYYDEHIRPKVLSYLRLKK